MKKVWEYMQKIFPKKAEKRMAPRDYERQILENEARKQFLKLKEKGLPIPIMTL